MLTRIITGLILLPLTLLAVIELSPVFFAVSMAVLIGIAAWEWSQLIGFHTQLLCVFYVFLVIVGLFFAAWLPALPFLLLGLIVWLWALVAIVMYQRKGQSAGFQIPVLRALSGFFVLIAAWDAIVLLQSSTSFGPAWLVFVLLIIWAADVGAYFVGYYLGCHALVSRVSPKKTWEGFFGGLCSSMLVALIGGFLFHLAWHQYVLLGLLGICSALFSVVGDLGVSLLKRIAGVKDTGKLFPGHGGLLDRLDSVAAATVLFALGTLCLGF